MRNRRRVIKVGAGLLSLCIAAWSLPPLIEKVDKVRSGELSAIPGLGGAGGEGATEETSGPIIITPGGESVTEQERARLMKQANAIAPLPLNGSANAARKPPKKGQDKNASKQARKPSKDEQRVEELQRLLEQTSSAEELREQLTDGGR